MQQPATIHIEESTHYQCWRVEAFLYDTENRSMPPYNNSYERVPGTWKQIAYVTEYDNEYNIIRHYGTKFPFLGAKDISWYDMVNNIGSPLPYSVSALYGADLQGEDFWIEVYEEKVINNDDPYKRTDVLWTLCSMWGCK